MLLTIGGLLGIAIIALATAFFVARGGSPHVKPSPKVLVEPEAEPEWPTIEASTSTPISDTEKLTSDPAADPEKRAAISSSQRQQLAMHSQTEDQLDFPDNPLPSSINISKDTTISDFHARSGAALSERWPLEPSQYSERDVTVLKRQLYELAGQLHLMQHKCRAIEQRVLEISSSLEHLDDEQQAQSRPPGSSSPRSYNG